MNPKKINKKGFGLLELLIISTIVISTFAAVMNSFLSFKKFEKRREGKMSKLAIKTYVNQFVSCSHTLSQNGASCVPGDFLEIRSLKNSIIIDKPSGSDYTTIGKYQLLAVCEDCPTCSNSISIQIKARRKSTQNTEEWVRMYTDIPFMCTYE